MKVNAGFEEEEECKYWEWAPVQDNKIFKRVRKNVNMRLRFDKKPRYLSTRWPFASSCGYLTPIAFAITFNREGLLGRLLKYGADVNAPCVWAGEDVWLPIELLIAAHKTAFLVLRRNPSVEFLVQPWGCSFCHYVEHNDDSGPVRAYVDQKRMRALCFCLREMGQSWPDIAWIIKEFL